MLLHSFYFASFAGNHAILCRAIATTGGDGGILKLYSTITGISNLFLVEWVVFERAGLFSGGVLTICVLIFLGFWVKKKTSLI